MRDIAALAEIAHNAGALLAVDNRSATPVLQRPLSLGADIVIHSGTKFLDRAGRVMAGATVSRKLVDECFNPSSALRAWRDAFNAWVVLKGLETLSLRVKAQCAQAPPLPGGWNSSSEVERGVRSRLASHPQHEWPGQQNGLAVLVLSFTVKADSPEQGRAVPSM